MSTATTLANLFGGSTTFGTSIGAPVAATLQRVMQQVQETSPDVRLLDQYLTEASGYEGNLAVLTENEARIGLANYLEAVGKGVEAMVVRAMFAQGEWPAEPDLGFSAEAPSAVSQLPAAAQRLLDGLRQANSEELDLARAVAQGITNIQPLNNNGYSTSIWTADAGGARIVLRAIQDMTGIGYAEAERSNNMMNMLAAEMGATSFTLPSMLIPIPESLQGQVRGNVMMVLPFAGEGFHPVGSQGSISDTASAQRISEADRITGALLSYLTRHNDARANNILVRDGATADTVEVRFIDHDNVLNRGAWYVARWGGQPRDDFFKGQSLGYSTDLSSFDRLPERDQVLVEGLLAMTPEQVSAMFNMPVSEAAVLREQAQHVRDEGLDGAITRFPVTAHG